MLDVAADLRDYLDRLAAVGEISTVQPEVDWNLELGAIVRRCNENGYPAPLFTTIKDADPEFRVLGAPVGVSRQPGLRLCRIALSLGLLPHASARDIVDALATARDRAPIAPRVVGDAPCKRHVRRGDDVDLTRLPVPLIHDGDGGRYLNTFGAIVAKTPDGRWTNWSIARIMLLGRNRMVGPFSPGQHIQMIRDEWARLGQAMPFALALGVEPAIPFVCATPLPDEVDEVGFLGGYYGRPVDVIDCETNDLRVPASAEIVIEGRVSLSDTAGEGPFGEYTGYLDTDVRQAPVYEVEAITYRDAPILPVVASGEPIEEDHTTAGVGFAADCLYAIRRAGLPVTQVWGPLESAQNWMVATVPTSWPQSFAGSAEELVHAIGAAFFGSRGGAMYPSIHVTYDDIDPSDLSETVWALAGRMNPGSGVIPFRGERILPLPPFWSRDEKRTARGTKAAYNCLHASPDTLPRRCSFRHGYPAAVQQSVLARWAELGLPQ